MTEHRNNDRDDDRNDNRDDNRDDKHRDERAARLDALYRGAGDVEPEAGLDRIIRARAGEASRTERSSTRLPWLGGLATASVAIVAIAVVLQQSPPSQPAQESFSPSEEREPEAYMSPSLGADAEMGSSNETRRARSEIQDSQSTGATQPAAAPPPSSAGLDDRANAVSEQQRSARMSDIVAEQAAKVAEPAHAVSETISADPDAMLARIEEMLEQGQLEPARDLLEAFRRKYPEHVIPERIKETLAPPE